MNSGDNLAKSLHSSLLPETGVVVSPYSWSEPGCHSAAGLRAGAERGANTDLGMTPGAPLPYSVMEVHACTCVLECKQSQVRKTRLV